MNYVQYIEIIINIIVIPIVVRYIYLIAYKNNYDLYEKEESIKIEFPVLFKLIMFIALPLCTWLCSSQYEIEQSIIDVLIVSPLLFLNIFGLIYFCSISVIIHKEWDYFKYRNFLFITKKIYYKDISYVQKKKKAIFIYLNNNKKIYLEEDLNNISMLFSQFGQNRVTVKKAIK